MCSKNAKGMTLLELMSVVAIVAVLSSLGVVAVRRFVVGTDLNRAVEGVQGVLGGARAQAMRTGRRMGVRITSSEVQSYVAPHRETQPLQPSDIFEQVRTSDYTDIAFTVCQNNVWLDHRGTLRDANGGFAQLVVVVSDRQGGRHTAVKMSVAGALLTVAGESSCVLP